MPIFTKNDVIEMNDNFPPVTIRDSELRFLKSRLLGKEYKIRVALPTGYAESKETYPVLYVLDADFSFGTIAETTRNLAAGRSAPRALPCGTRCG
jgi:predicted alpha/beta superfamily hydrolase